MKIGSQRELKGYPVRVKINGDSLLFGVLVNRFIFAQI